MTAFKQFDFTHEGKLYRAELHRDDDMGKPWEEHDGHGVYNGRTYDKAASVARALEEQWGIGDAKDVQKLRDKIGRWPNAQDIAEEAAAMDHKRMRAWMKDEWFWCGVVVYALDDEYNKVGKPESLWGIESDSFEYMKNEVAPELAEQLRSDSL